MARVIIEIAGGLRAQAQYHVFESDEVWVGRGMTNDLIVSDPHVSERHLRVARAGEELLVQDLGSLNGTYLPKMKRTVTEASIGSGDEVIIGTTKLRVFTDTHPVAPVRPLHLRHAAMDWLRRPVVAWSAAALFTGNSMLDGYLDSDSAITIVKLLPHAISALVLILFWSGIWSFVGRLTRHKIRFHVHLSLICVTLVLSDVLDVAVGSAEFYSNSQAVGTGLAYLGYGALFIGLLHLTLGSATSMRPRKRLLASGISVLLIIAAVAGLSAAYHDRLGPPFSKTFRPPLGSPPHGQSIEQFLAHTRTVYHIDLQKP